MADEQKELNTVKLDGNEVSKQQLEEAQKNQAIRIVESKDKPGEFKTLQHLKD
jgi:hypothetical protein